MCTFIRNFILFFVIIMLVSCSNDEDIMLQNSLNFIDPLEYLPLKSGNYWVLQTYTNEVSQPDILVPSEFIDSIYVVSDTIINGLKHHNLYVTRYEIINDQKSNVRTYLLTSLRTKDSRMINMDGATYFSTDTILKAHYGSNEVNNKTVYTVTGKAKYVTNLSLPVGTSDALKWEVVHFTDKSISTSGNDEYQENSSIYFVKSIGFGKIVINGDLYPSNNKRSEKHLIRYSVK